MVFIFKGISFKKYAEVKQQTGKVEAEEMIDRRVKYGIGSSLFSPGLHLQPDLNDPGLFININYPYTDYAGGCDFYLTSGFSLSESQKDTVVKVLKNEQGS